MKTRLRSVFRHNRYRGSIAASITNFVLLLFIAVLLTACSATSVVIEPQNRQLNAGMARIFFIRHSSFLSRLGKPDIKVDDELVGSLAVGSYFVVDRPPGRHRVTVSAWLDPTDWQTSMDLQPGASYYLELGPIVRVNIDRVKLESMGITGQPLPGRFGLNSPFMLYILDPSAGAAAVARLRARSS